MKTCSNCGKNNIRHDSDCFICGDCGYSWSVSSMDKIISQVEAGVAKRKAQKADAINPSHYSRWKIEPLDFIMANNLDFLRGNIIKYIMRYDAKGGLEDLKKALVYLDKLIEKVERENDRA